MRAATFTTYVNAQIDPNLEAAFARQTRIATTSYATITRSAEAATRATAGLLAGRGTAGVQATTRAIENQARATNASTMASAAQERQAARVAIAQRRQVAETERLSNSHRGLARNLNTTATAFGIVEGRMSPLAGHLITVARAAEQLSGLQLGLAGVGATLFALGRSGNEYATLASRLRPFYDSQQQANGAMERVIGIAQRSRTSLESVVEIYARLTANSKELGLSQERVGRLTEFASKAATLSGGTKAARDTALVQFAQAIGSNFQSGAGQEFNSLQEGASQVSTLLARYFKNADGSIGTTISNLKKLSAEGKLTTEQIAEAADRATPALERMFGAIPKTLGSAGTEFANALTVMVGRFDQNVGLTSNLAEALSLVANNLRAITGLIVGIAAGFAAVKIGGFVAGITSAINQTIIMNAAVTTLSQRRAAAAAASQAQHAREVAALQAEGAAIRANMALLQRQRAVAAADVVRASPTAVTPGSPRRVTAALAEQTAATRGLVAEQQRLNIINNALTAANGRLATSTTAAAAASQAASARMGLLAATGTRLRGVFGSLVSFLGGPWGIAFAAATTAVYLLVTAQSAAERAAERLSQSQAALGQFVDATTGKILRQSAALREQAAIDSDTRVSEARKDYELARSNAANYRVLSNDPAVRAIQDRYRTGGLTAGGATRQLTGLRDQRPELAGQINSLIGYFARATTQAQSAISEQAANRQLRGKGTPYDAQIVAAGGNLAAIPRGAQEAATAAPRTKAQIDAEAKRRAARTETERARADLAKIRAEGKAATESEDQYIDRLAAAEMAVKSAAAAEKAARSARSAGAAQERKEARDAIQDAKDAAAARRDAATEALLKGTADPTSKDFMDARLRILQTYDDEINKIDASAAASHSATTQRLADLKKEEEAAPGRGEKRKDILAQYDDAPKAVDRARDQIDDLQKNVDHLVDGIEKISDENPLGRGIYTQEMAEADAQRIEEGVRKPLRDMQQEAARNLEIAKLTLQGYDDEAEALRRSYQLLDAMGEVRAEDYDILLGNVRQEQRINDLLASRERVVGLIKGTVDSTRDTFEQFLTDLPSGVGKAAGNAFKSFQQRFIQIGARQLTERLFAGADAKVRELLTGKADVNGAMRDYVEKLGTGKDAVITFSDVLLDSAEKFKQAFADIGAPSSGIGGTDVGTTPGNVGAVVANTIAGGSASAAGIVAVASAAAGKALAANDNADPQGQDIIVTGQRVLKQATQVIQGRAPTATEAYRTVFKQFGSNIDETLHNVFGKKDAQGNYDPKQGGALGLGNTQLFSKIGDAAGKAFGGAATGSMVNSVLKPIGKALGFKTSQTGAQIGGAIGSFVPIPFGKEIGAVVGSIIGGLFKKTKYGTSTLSMNAYGELGAGTVVGRGGAQKAAATGAASSVAEGLSNIATQLGATISGAPNLTIGMYNDKYRVSTTGRTGKLKSKYSDVVDFGKDGQQEAIEYAIRYAIEKSVLTGISQASINILKSGQDLEKAVTKAGVIESIPKRLMAIQDPIRYAVTTLNTEFAQMISYLKEGGATAAQFADAQKLYELERADAIKQAMASAGSAIDDFLKEMAGGSSSPFSKRTVYNNAGAALSAFQSDIASGKAVDQNDLLSAARNFQDASRALYGSSSSFFSDFEMLRSLLEKARDNAGITSTDVSTLPASPFADSSVQAAINGLSTATATSAQATADQVSSKLDEVIDAINLLRGGKAITSAYLSGAIKALPGFG